MSRLRIARAVSGLCGAAVLVALSGFVSSAPVEAGTVMDGSGRTVTIKDTSRIVSIGGAVTEVLYALGLESRIAAVDSTSLYPPRALREKKNVGYMRQLSAEGVLGLAPSAIFAIAGSGPRETMAVLAEAGIPMLTVPDDFTADGILTKVRLIAEAADAVPQGECLAQGLRDEFARLASLRAQVKTSARVMFILSFVNGRAMVAGRQTAADGIIRLAGARNAIEDYEGYKPLNDEAAVAARPDVVLVMTRSSAENLTAEDVFKHPALRLSPAAAKGAFVAMDALYLLGFGPRTASAARELAHRIYSDLPGAMPAAGTPLSERCRP